MHATHPREWWFIKRALDGREAIPVAYAGKSVFHTSSARGEYPKDRRYTMPQVLSTLYQAIGVDPAMTFLDGSGRPRYVLDDRPSGQ